MDMGYWILISTDLHTLSRKEKHETKNKSNNTNMDDQTKEEIKK